MKKIAIFVLSVVSLFLVVGCSNSTSTLPDHLGTKQAKTYDDIDSSYVVRTYFNGNDIKKEDNHDEAEKARYDFLEDVLKKYNSVKYKYQSVLDDGEKVDTDDVAEKYGYLYLYYTLADEYLTNSDEKTELLDNYKELLKDIKQIYDDNADS